MDCETHGIIVDLLTNFSDGVHEIQRFCNAHGVGQVSLASTSSSSRTDQELREAADPDSDRTLVLKWSCCQAYYLSTAVAQDTVLAVGLGGSWEATSGGVVAFYKFVNFGYIVLQCVRQFSKINTETHQFGGADTLNSLYFGHAHASPITG